MWRNYLTVGIRSLMKNRVYAGINIAGLAIGMAACIMILVFVRYESGFDSALPGARDAYQLQTYYTQRDTGETMNLQMAAYVTKGALTKDFPQIEKAVYAQSGSPILLKNGQAEATEDFTYVDGPLTDVLQLPYVAGNPATALGRPGSIVLTQSEAGRQFGSVAGAMGKTLTVVANGKETDYRVTGIIADIPKNSHFKASFLARYDPNTYYAEQPDFLKSWGWQSGWVYLKLKPGTDPAAINSQLKAWEKRNIPDEHFGDRTVNQGDEADFGLVNIRDIHLGRAQEGAMTPGNSRQSIVTFAVIGLLILGMACINFTNLATARASQRAREVALRKVLGAGRQQLIGQFLAESVLVAAIAMLIALALVELALPLFARFLDASLNLHYFGAQGILAPAIILVVLVGLAGGLYPAFYLSRFQPARVLKANKSAADAEGSGKLRNILVVAQFAVSIGLIICTAVIYAQTIYARTVDPGFKREGLMQVDNIRRRQLTPIVETLAQETARLDNVVGVGRTQIGVSTQNNMNNGVQVPGRQEPVTIGNYNVDLGFFDTMGIKLVAGRQFSAAQAMDDMTTPYPEQPDAERALVARGINVVVNELAVKRMGFASPQAAIGKQVKIGFDDAYGGVLPVTIVGVVQDSRFRSIREPIDAIMFRYHRIIHDVMEVRYRGSPAEARAKVEQVWRRLAPQVPFEAKFTEEIIGDLYKAEDARAKMFAGFAGLAVIIGCLGLFGLAAFTAERRTKEIGIRKVLGATTGKIVQLLVWQFSRPVLIANLIAWPAAYWLMRDWLNTFDARITLTPAPFLGAGLLALVIAVATIAAHSMKVARANPIQALRYE